MKELVEEFLLLKQINYASGPDPVLFSTLPEKIDVVHDKLGPLLHRNETPYVFLL